MPEKVSGTLSLFRAWTPISCDFLPHRLVSETPLDPFKLEESFSAIWRMCHLFRSYPARCKASSYHPGAEIVLSSCAPSDVGAKRRLALCSCQNKCGG